MFLSSCIWDGSVGIVLKYLIISIVLKYYLKKWLWIISQIIFQMIILELSEIMFENIILE